MAQLSGSPPRQTVLIAPTERGKSNNAGVPGVPSPAERLDSSSTTDSLPVEFPAAKRPFGNNRAAIANLQELNSFTRAVNQTVQSFQAEHSSPVAKVEQLLTSLRKRFDDVHVEVKRRSEEVAIYKEGIRQADSAEHQATSDRARFLQRAEELEQSLAGLQKKVNDVAHTKKVYSHILQRTKLEKDMVRQKNLLLQRRLKSLALELKEGCRSLEKQQRARYKAICDLKQTEQELEAERLVREQGLKEMDEAIELKREAVEKRQRLVDWQQSVVHDAAAAALSASSGRWRRMLCVEKLIANSLQKTNVENVEKWQYKEDTFQKIREATGLVDVMEIVNKFLNRDSENQKLKHIAAEAEKQLEASRKEYQEIVRRAVEDLALGNCSHIRNLYAALDAQAVSWNKTLHSHVVKQNLLKHSLRSVDQAKRCAVSINAKLVQLGIEAPFNFNEEAALEQYCQHLSENSIQSLLSLPDASKN